MGDPRTFKSQWSSIVGKIQAGKYEISRDYDSMTTVYGRKVCQHKRKRNYPKSIIH